MERLNAFNELIDHTIEATWSAEDYFLSMALGARVLAEKMHWVGDSASQIMDESSETNEVGIADYLFHFEWADQAKNFLILWRDILFEQQKAAILWKDKKTEKDALNQLKEEALVVVKEAAKVLKNFPQKKWEELSAGRNGEKKQIENWQQQTNPWSKYREQIGDLAEQCTTLEERHRQLLETATALWDVRLLIDENSIFCNNEFNSFKETVQQTEEYIEANKSEPGKVVSYLEDLEADLKMTSYASSFTHALDAKLSCLPEKIQIPVNTNRGLIQQREVFFQRRSRQWLESEVLPILYEVWELTERTGNSLKMSLVNIRNRAILLSKNEEEVAQGIVDLCQPIHSFLKNSQDNKAELLELEALISHRLKDSFELSAIYRSEEFLSIPLQSTIEQMRLDQSPILTKIREWSQNLGNRLQQVRSDVVQESVLSLSEKIVRFVQERTPDPDNSHYNNIFLTKGYIGESFVVGREDELAHVRKIISNWRLGFRGAVILSGRRFSGKSLFGELVASRHFIGRTIRVTPNSSLQVDSRKTTTTANLGEALKFIEKHTLGGRQLVWIDDLELWADANISLSENVRQLRQSIDSLSDRLFFLVSMSTWMGEHLNRFHDLDHVFQAEINLDLMSAAEIRQAILIRHGAAHRTLVDGEGKEVSPQQFQRMTEQIFKLSHGNIGDALNRWSAAIRRVDEEKVMHESGARNTLPNFIRPDNMILLRTLLLEKRTNEYRLRRTFGPSFRDKYSGILQRLLRTGLLSRQLDGWLEVNEVAANDVGRLIFGE